MNTVQPIVVRKDSTHEATLVCAAVASVNAFMKLAPEAEEKILFEQWLSGPFTKTVRRASEAQFAKFADWCERESVPVGYVELYGAQAIACSPLAYDAFPSVLSRLQVSGTDFPRKPVPVPATATATVVVLDSLTTGKASAQAAHALWSFSLSSQRIEPWEPQAIQVSLLSAERLASVAQKAIELNLRPIIDHGLTEVEPQTLTAVCVPTLLLDP